MRFGIWKTLFLIVFILGAVVFSLRLLSGEDDWICNNGQWVKHGQPSAPQPTESCGKAVTKPMAETKDPVQLKTPTSGVAVASPFFVEGKASGTWYFEGIFGVKLMDKVGRILAESQAIAQGDWMQKDFVPFQSELSFNVDQDTDAFLVFGCDNPSGLPENNCSFSVPVRLKSNHSQNVKIFFSTPQSGDDCSLVSAVNRPIVKTAAVARAAILELLKGPTVEETLAGFYSNLNPSAHLQNISIVNGVAKVDFSAELENGAGGSCRVSAIRSQITQTLKQFSTVKEVIISINGHTEDILQP